MARRPLTTRQRFEALLAEHAPEIQAAFLAAIDDITSQAQIGRIATLLERGDIDGAIRAVHLDPAAFRAFERAIADAYNAGGTAAVGSLPALRDPDGGRLVIRFDARHPRAERWLTEHSSTLVTRIVEDQRTAIRMALTEGMARGENPRTTALDIVGRVNRATGQRTGGIIGMTSAQEQWSRNARAELLSGDVEQLRNYLTRETRDRRFDRAVMRAINDGTPLPRETVSRAIGNMNNNLLRLRGETIARTESLASFHSSAREAMMQAVDTGAVQRQNVTKTWRATLDARTRDTHAAVNGETVPMDERFSNGLLHPHEEGAPAAEVIACRCAMTYSVDHLAGLE